jgi:hypothetical protein
MVQLQSLLAQVDNKSDPLYTAPVDDIGAPVKFIKSEFTPGEYAAYGGRFVARFKRGGRGEFLTFLCKNFTVEEYFSRLNAGQAPLAILMDKGFQPSRLRLAATGI